MMAWMAKKSDIGGYDPIWHHGFEARGGGGGGLNPSSKEVGKRGIGRKSGNGLKLVI